MTINISNIKTQFKSVLDTANTTTAAADLSSGLNTRVQKVLKVNPSMIPIQASYIPWVTVFTDSKTVKHETIAVNQLIGKRSSEIALKVVGAVWETTVADVTEDEADENIEILMENVEEVLRRNFKLNNSVSWTRVSDVTYHTLPNVAEQTHMRIGVMTLIARVDY